MKYFYMLSLMFSFNLLTYSQQKIIILHTNDLHSRLEGFAPESDYSPGLTGNDKTFGGFSRIASIIESEKGKGNTVLVLDAGDFLMGTLFHTLEEDSGFQLRLMKLIGYDAVALGNHEFDFGPEFLSAVISGSASRGEIPQVLLGNAVTSTTDNRDNGLEKLYTDGLLRKYSILEKGGIKIGIFSLMGENAAEVAPYATPVKFEKRRAFAERTVSYLRKNGCNLVICLSHSGLTFNAEEGWEGEDYELAKEVSGIDLVISGHTHSRLSSPLIAGNTPVIQAGEYGREVGRMELMLNAGRWVVNDYKLIAVDDRIEGIKSVQERVDGQKINVSKAILSPFGIEYSKPVIEVDNLVECIAQGDPSKGGLGPLVADAIYAYVNSHSSKGTDLAMVSAGVIRDNFYPGKQSIADIFRVMPLGKGNDRVPGYPFSRLYVTGREIKNILEILLVAQKSNTDYHCYFSGIRVKYLPEKGLLKKIVSIEMQEKNGEWKSVDLSKKNNTLYSISANSYMLEFIGIIKKKSFGLINVVPKDSEGNKVVNMKEAVIDIDEKSDGIQEGKEWLALFEYLKAMEDTDGNNIPDLVKRYYSPGTVFEVDR